MSRRTLGLVAATAALSSTATLSVSQVVRPAPVQASHTAPTHRTIDAQLRKLTTAMTALTKRVDRVHQRTYENCLHIIFSENELREHANAAKFVNPVQAAQGGCVVGNYTVGDGYDPEKDAGAP